MTDINTPILIAGGGIGGMATALALSQAGYEVQVFERAPEVREIGAGITLCTNAMVALNCLGVGDKIRAQGAHLTRSEFQSSRARLLKRIPMEELESNYGAPSIGIGRRELLETLRKACDGIPIHTSSRCIGYEQDGEGVTLKLETRERIRGSILIGADGLWSSIRAQLLGDGLPRYSGTTSWRGICPTNEGAEAENGSAFVVLGSRSIRGGGWYVDDQRVSWFFGFNTPPGGVDDPGKLRGVLRSLLKGWSGPMPHLIENTPLDQIIRTDLYGRGPVAKWGEGRVTLLGDAAHPMGNAIGQGAAQALEDAVILAESLQTARNEIEGLRAYEERRKPRTNLVTMETRHTGKSMHLENPYLCWIRNMAIRTIPVEKVLARWRLVMDFEDGRRIMQCRRETESCNAFV